MFEGIKNMFVGGKPEEPKNQVEETPIEQEEKKSEEEVNKREIGLSQETKKQLSARHALNPDGTVRIPADEAFENNQERAA